jgi:membrane protein required for colicin V production
MIYLIIETILGYKRGFVKSVLLFLSWIISFGGSALLVREFVSNNEKLNEFSALFEEITGSGVLAKMAACVLVFLIVMIMIKIICHIIIHLSGIISDIPVVGTLNKLLGGIFGFLKGAILVFVVFLIYSVYNGKYIDELWQQIPDVMSAVDWLKDYLQQLWMTIK